MLTADPVGVGSARLIRTRVFALIGLIVLIAFGIGLRLYFFQPGLARSPDEYTYTAQANLILNHGSAAFAELGDQIVANPVSLAIRPSPVRAGYLWMLAGFMELTGEHGPLAGASIALASSCLNLCLLALAAWRWLSPRAAVLAALLCAVSPCDLVIARRAWQDAWIELLCSLVLVATLAMLTSSTRRKPWLLAGFGLLGLGCALTKENAALFFALGATIVAGRYFFCRNYRLAAMVTFAATTSLAFAFGILAVLFHGPANLLRLERVCLYFSANGTYELQFDSGSPLLFGHALLSISPIVTLAALLGCAVLAYRKFVSGISPNIVLLVLAAFSLCMLVFQVATGRYNLRYTAPIFGALILLGASTLDEAWSIALRWMAPLGRPVAMAILTLSLLVGALRDFNFGRDRFLNAGIPDLSLRMVLSLPPAALPANYETEVRR